MTKHDDLILVLANKSKLIELFGKEFGVKGSWSSYHWVDKNKIEEWKLEDVQQLLNSFKYIKDNFVGITQETKSKTCGEIKEEFSKQHREIENLTLENSFEIERTFEFPVVNKYKNFTIGFIDLIIHIKPVRKGFFTSYKEDEPIEWIIEVKKSDDFKNFGEILRQIKQYKTYYNYENSFKSKIIKVDEYMWRKVNRKFVVIAPQISDEIKNLFTSEGITCIELESLNKEVELLKEEVNQ